MLILDFPLNTSLSTGLIKHYYRALVWQLRWVSLQALCGCRCLNIIFNINFAGALSINLNTTLSIILESFAHMQILNKKLVDAI